MIVIILFFVAIPVIIGVIAKYSRNFFFDSDNMNDLANTYDAESVSLPRSPATIKSLRHHHQIGDKIVFTHHIVGQVNSYRKTVVRTILKTLVIEFILIAALSIGAASKITNEVNLFDGISLLMYEWKVYYFTPLGMAAICIELFFYYQFLSEQLPES